jgi:exopolysaccharide biosynthesis polyprenyl glycosylphosphotransferase
MKKSEIIFNVILVPLDFVAIVVAAFFSYYLRNTVSLNTLFIGSVQFTLEQYILTTLIGSLVFLLFLALNGLYVLKNTRRIYGEIFKVFVATSTATLTIIIALFFTQHSEASRFLILGVWLFSFVFITIERVVLRIIQRALFRRGRLTRKIVLIGNNHATRELAKTYKENPRLGYTVVDDIQEMDVEHTLQRLSQIKNSEAIDEIVQANPVFSAEDVSRIVDFCYEYHIDFKYTPDIFKVQATNIAIQTISGIPVIELKKTPLEGWGRVAKRIIDIIGGLVGIILFGIPMLIVAFAVKLDSEGPVIYKNERVNHRGKKFYVFKFRSYKKEFCTGDIYGGKQASQLEDELIQKMSLREGPLHKIDASKDFRLTRVGKFIRKTSLDELPQFFNVFLGDLSLVGPRPHMPKEVAKYKKHHKRVLTIKPGVTGLPALNGRSDLSFDDEVRLDLYYIENWSLLLDLKILLMTPFALLRKPKAEA